MIKSKLIEILGAKCGITYTEAERYLRLLENILCDSLRANEKVQWHGIGTWSIFHAKPTLRRNPQTGELMRIPAHKRAKFVAGDKLKRSVL